MRAEKKSNIQVYSVGNMRNGKEETEEEAAAASATTKKKKKKKIFLVNAQWNGR